MLLYRALTVDEFHGNNLHDEKLFDWWHQKPEGFSSDQGNKSDSLQAQGKNRAQQAIMTEGI